MLEAGVTVDLAQLVIDNDIIEMIKATKRGIPVNEDTLAIDLIHKVGAWGNYMAEDHTLKYMRSLSLPNIIDRNDYHRWAEAGKKSIYERAQEKVLNILKNYQQPKPLTKEIKDRIRFIVEEAEDDRGVAGFWKGIEDRKEVGAGKT
jgi:trimethylamine--corrinoid protein Co-methyltransferase